MGLTTQSDKTKKTGDQRPVKTGRYRKAIRVEKEI